MKKIAVIICFSTLLSGICGCRSTPVCNAARESSSNVVERILLDSIVVHDSIYVLDRADTVFVTRYRTLYRDRFRHDTIARCDTVYRERVIKVPPAVDGEGGSVKWWAYILLLLVVWRSGLMGVVVQLFKKLFNF